MLVLKTLWRHLTVNLEDVSNRSLARMGWLLPLLTVSCSMSVHLLSGNARDVPFFISESDYPGIERWIFTTGLAMSGVALGILSHRFKTMFATDESVKVQISHLSGMTTSVSLVVVAFANMYDYLILHCIAAILVFCGGLIWGGSTHSLFDQTKRGARKLRRFGLGLALIGFVGMNAAITAYVAFNRSELTQNGSLQIRLDEIQPVVDFAAPGEYILFLGLIITMASIDWDLKENDSFHPSD